MIELVENGDEIILEFTLPSDKTQEELIWQMSEELDALLEGYFLYEKNIKITGKITTGMCLWIGYNRIGAMSSSGLTSKNYRMRTKLINNNNLTVSTNTAITYSLCYAPFFNYEI